MPWQLLLARLEGLVRLDNANGFTPDPVLRLAAMLANEDAARSLAESLKFSNADRDRLAALAGRSEEVLAPMPPHEARVLLYKHDVFWFKDMVRLHWAAAKDATHGQQWRALLSLADTWQKPRFPLDGRDVMAAGVEEGPRIGHILADIEEWWLARDFQADRAALLARLKAILRVHGG